MAIAKDTRLNFNRGLVSRLAAGRQDLDRVALSARTMTNWMPRVLGSMMLRPGLKMITTGGATTEVFFIPFVFARDDTALLKIVNGGLFVLVDDELITLPEAVSTATANGLFAANLTSWTDADETGGTSQWTALGYNGNAGGYMELRGNGFNAAIRKQQVTVVGGDQNKEHFLRVIVELGKAVLRVGSTEGGDQYVTETTIGVGEHNLAFTPTGNFWVHISNRRKSLALIDSIQVVSDLVLGATINTSIDGVWVGADCAAPSTIRYAQSGDVVYIACSNSKVWKVERRSTRSWSLVLFEPEDGPFLIENTGPIHMSCNAVSGGGTLTASAPFFRAGHVGALFRLQSAGQIVTVSAAGAGQWSNSIRISGVGANRGFQVDVTGTWVGTVTVQQSVGEAGAWVSLATYTGNVSLAANDGLDNQIIHYRIGIDTGDYTSGTAVCTLTYAGGSIIGVVRVRQLLSETAVTVEILEDLGGTAATDIWWEGAWSTYRGYPTALTLWDGRLFLAGRASVWGSISDAYESFDDELEGDAGPISRSLGQGPIDVVNWLLPTHHLLIGSDMAEKSAFRSQLDEPTTPTTFSVRSVSTQGSIGDGITYDSMAAFISRSQRRVYELSFDGGLQDYMPSDLTAIIPEIGEGNFVQLAIQRQPDTRIHALRADGTVAVLVYDKAENVRGWIELETDATAVRNIVVLPGASGEDQVYYYVDRNGTGNLERWAREDECVGGQLNRQADSFVEYTGVATTSITGLAHLNGETVVVWADGEDVGTKVVSGGGITLDVAAANVIAGLGYTANYASTKLRDTLGQDRRILSIYLLLVDVHAQGLLYGPDADTLDALPLIKEGAAVDEDEVFEEYDVDAFEFNGTYTTDSRIYLRAAAPRPATVCALVISHEGGA